MARALLISLLALWASAVRAAELPLSSIVYTGAPSTQSPSGVASNGMNFLVAWSDLRDLSHPATYAVRIGSDGGLLDQPAILIPNGFGAAPVVAWTGRVYVLAWGGTRGLFFVRIDTDGHVLDPTPRNIGKIDMSPFGAASGPDRAMLVCMVNLTASPLLAKIHAVLFDIDGNVANADIPIGPAREGTSPVIASSDQSFYIAWAGSEGGQLVDEGAVVSFDGSVGQGQVIAPSRGGPSVASNGTDFVVSYLDGLQRLAVKHIDRDGTPLAATVLSQQGSTAFTGNLIGRFGNGYIVAATDSQQHSIGVILDGHGNPVGETALASSQSLLVSNGKATLAVWSGALVETDIFARIVGTQSSDTLVSVAAAQQFRPQIAFGGSCYLSSWVELRGLDGLELRVGRVALDGHPLDGQGILLADHISDRPQVVFDRQNFVVAWTDGSSIFINRMSTAGILLDGLRGRVAIEGVRGTFGLGTNGVESLLVWTAPLDPSSAISSIRAMRIGRDGTLFPPMFTPLFVNDAVEIAVAGTSTTWLATWDDAFVVGMPPTGVPAGFHVGHNILAARMTAGLNLLDFVPLSISADETNNGGLSVASGLTDFAVAWDEADNSGGSVHARTVAEDGSLRDSRLIAAGAAPSVARIADDFAIAWQDQSGLSWARFAHLPFVLPLAPSGDEESNVALTAGPDETLIAVYQRVASEPVYGNVSRTFARLFTPPQPEPRKRIAVH